MPIPFRARARTIDHLGREQIADCPTAISELWKNAYDAYARRVALHIFDGEVTVAAVVDDGHGMDLGEFIDKWLVIGTEAKVSRDDEVPEADRNGLPYRARQGKKGIGRLSVGALGPVCLVVSKRRQRPFVAALLDWRLFENPYLNLDDVLIPVEEFEAAAELGTVVNQLFDDLVDNIWVKDQASERKQRVEHAWHRWDAEHADSDEPPSRRIANIALSEALSERHFAVFPALKGEVDAGTAIYVLDVYHELDVWVGRDPDDDDAESKQTRDRLRQTLTGFIDPFSSDAPDFAYSVEVHQEGRSRIVVSHEEVFGHRDLHSLEHYLEGSFDRYGVFRGMVRAFSEDPKPFKFTPRRPPPSRGTGYAGPCKLCIGTFEVDPRNSTHPRQHHQGLMEKAERFAGLAVYRSGLRVMPYGRPDNDYFGLEERRSMHAGRAFWAHRRSFGRVAVDGEANPNLRDKAGREGLIDNRALRELRLLVIGVLREAARLYFGSDAPVRGERLPEIQARNKAAKDAEDAVKNQKRVFRAALRSQAPGLERALEEAATLAQTLERTLDADDIDAATLERLGAQIEQANEARSGLRLPRKPARLGRTEAAYRRYRDRYEQLCETLKHARERWTAWSEEHNPTPAVEHVRRSMARHQAFLTKMVTDYEKRIGSLLEAESRRIDKQAREDRGRYYQRSAPILEGVEHDRISRADALLFLEEEREALHDDIKARYDSYVTALEDLAKGTDLSGAVVWSEEQRQAIEREMEQVHALAQLGITVEIIGHELNELDSEIDRGLRRLPVEVQALPAYQTALRAHQAMMDRIHFLAPLRLAGPRLKERIHGRELYDYLRDFFRDRLDRRAIEFTATEAFCDFSVVEYPHRVYPVFVNLLNNAIYWLTHVEARRIVLDRVADEIIVADSGPGVDPDDIPHIFELFFTRRADGRGVGLYLCRVNLEAGQHQIEYIRDSDRKVLSGANFAIRFKQEIEDD